MPAHCIHTQKLYVNNITNKMRSHPVHSNSKRGKTETARDRQTETERQRQTDRQRQAERDRQAGGENSKTLLSKVILDLVD